MDSGIPGGSNGDLKLGDSRKVYTRRPRGKLSKNNNNNNETATATTSTSADPTASKDPTTTNPESPTTTNATTNVPSAAVPTATTAEAAPPSTSEVEKVKDGGATQSAVQEGSGSQVVERSSVTSSNKIRILKRPLASENDSSIVRQVEAAVYPIREDKQNVEESVAVPPQIPSGNGPASVSGVVKPLVISTVNDKVKFSIFKETPKIQVEELRRSLQRELEGVGSLLKRIEARELQLASPNTQISNIESGSVRNDVGAEASNIGGYGNPQPVYPPVTIVTNRSLLRVNTAVGYHEPRPVGLTRMHSDLGVARNLEPRPYNRQLSVSVAENAYRPVEYVEKEKRTPKANQMYRNSEFLLSKDRLPPESNKRLKANNGRKLSLEKGRGVGYGFGMEKNINQAFKSCSSLLQRLMKHKHGWVFNEPVNAKALGLLDYHDVIKHPMDLGTIKNRLSQNLYKLPREFAEDVRLVFHNAMTYNPKGQDVHVMAEELLEIFEERWTVIEAELYPPWNYQMYQDSGTPTPTSRRGPSQQPQYVLVPAYPGLVQGQVPTPLFSPVAPQMISQDSIIAQVPVTSRPIIARTAAPKKPKAKDLNKRDMTYDEKQKLSTNLQGLPPEKLDSIVQIIKKRNTTHSQNDDEIEVDIDSVDIETLWELDRFVTNYKKSLSKNRRRAELQAEKAAGLAVSAMKTTQAVPQAQNESGTATGNGNAPPAVDSEKQNHNASRSSSSSSSSSDSGSSSSDSDSDSSSADVQIT